MIFGANVQFRLPATERNHSPSVLTMKIGARLSVRLVANMCVCMAPKHAVFELRTSSLGGKPEPGPKRSSLAVIVGPWKHFGINQRAASSP